MKLLMVLAGLMMSAQAFALSWEEVKANPARYRIESPRVYFSPGVSKRLVDWGGSPATCIAGDQIYGGEHQRCMASGNDDDNYTRWNCPKGKLKTFQLYKDIVGTRTICLDNDDDGDAFNCKRPKTLPYEIETNVKVSIYKKNQIDDDDTLSERHQAYVGHVRVQLPQCN
ncbi:MAG: hypothetical protein HRT45_09810 [Bdellovibrionales bacterium]|nr:hypothetical protein [Bdellovibrionales bacterium]